MVLLETPAPCMRVFNHQHQSLQRFQSVTEQITLLYEGNLLFQSEPDPQELASFIEGAAETRC